MGSITILGTRPGHGGHADLGGGRRWQAVLAASNVLGWHYYFHASGDVLYAVSALDAPVAAQVLAALPAP